VMQNGLMPAQRNGRTVTARAEEGLNHPLHDLRF
jgi:hypothetical protein